MNLFPRVFDTARGCLSSSTLIIWLLSSLCYLRLRVGMLFPPFEGLYALGRSYAFCILLVGTRLLSPEPALWKRIFLRKFEIEVRIFACWGGVLPVLF